MLNIKVMVIKIRVLSVEENLDKIRPYLRDIINDLKQSDTWKIQLTISEDNEEHVVHSKSDNMKIVISDEADEVIIFFFLIHINLQFMRGSEFVFNYLQLLYYKCHKININRGGSYIDSPDWIKNKQQ